MLRPPHIHSSNTVSQKRENKNKERAEKKCTEGLLVESNIRYIVGGAESKNELFNVVTVIDSFNSVTFKVSCGFVT